jgi:hypothetical protein
VRRSHGRRGYSRGLSVIKSLDGDIVTDSHSSTGLPSWVSMAATTVPAGMAISPTTFGSDASSKMIGATGFKRMVSWAVAAVNLSAEATSTRSF